MSFETKEGYTQIIGSGIRSGAQEVFDSGRLLSKILESTKAQFLLIDYSQVITRVSSADIFNIVRVYETKMKDFYEVCMAIIINPEDLHLEEYWEEICLQRGFKFKIFLDGTLAQSWLQNQMKPNTQ